MKPVNSCNHRPILAQESAVFQGFLNKPCRSGELEGQSIDQFSASIDPEEMIITWITGLCNLRMHVIMMGPIAWWQLG
jgi:hypothetical protein